MTRQQTITHRLTRRSVLKRMLGASAVAPSAVAASMLAGAKPALAGTKVPYGVAVALEPFRNEPRMRELLIEHADIIVPMNALKWASLRHTAGEFDFSGADEIISFAEAHGKRIHGHALLWYAFNPQWIDAVMSPSRLERLLVEHIETVMGRYAGRIATWDVANEVISHDPLNEGRWRYGVWYNVLGPRHLDIAFQTAARVDPSAKLYLNDYDLEDNSLRTKARQDALLGIVDRLQGKNIPIHGIGLQAHLYAEREIGVENLHRFVLALKERGLTVSVTELDVIDWKLSAEHQRRDRAVAAVADEFLSALTGVTTPDTITSWGLSDSHSWIGDTFPREDDAKARPLPFDAEWRAKALWDVLRRHMN